MRWSGLAIQDAITLERKEVQHDRPRASIALSQAVRKPEPTCLFPFRRMWAKRFLPWQTTTHAMCFGRGGEGYNRGADVGARYIRPLFEAAGLIGKGHMLSHRLRDTFAVDLLEKGVPLEEVSKLLGHTSIKTTEKHYAAWIKGRQDRLDSLVMGTWAARKKARRG